MSALGKSQVKVDRSTRFPHIKITGESESIDNLFFAGPLAYTKISSLLIHGFIKMVPKTMEEISKRFVKQLV